MATADQDIRPRRLRTLLVALLCPLALWGLTLRALEWSAREAEVEHGAYLWWWEEWRVLFTPTNYVGRGAGRTMLVGASEVREGVLVDELERALPEGEYVMDAFSMATLEMTLLQLRYVEHAYGAGAMPSEVLLGITPRWALNIPRRRLVPLLDSIERYSPVVELDDDLNFHPRSALDSLEARWQQWTRGGGRWRNGLVLHARRLRSSLRSIEAAPLETLGLLLPPKWHHLPQRDHSQYMRVAGENYIEPGATTQLDHIAWQLGKLRELVEQHGGRLLVVEMPEGPWQTAMVAPELREDYMQCVEQTLGGVPRLDLTHALQPEHFFDWSHPTRAGAELVTQRVIEFLRAHGQ